MPKNLSFVFFFGVLFAFSPAYAQSAKVTEYVKQHLMPISINPDTDNFNDLAPLKQILQNRRIVGMGEATHGSHEFFAMKHRMLEFLVTQMGYRVFAIEANFTECRAVNDYVLYGKGDAKKVIAGMYFWTWNTTEVLKMVEWMRSYNTGKAYADQVKFYGFDMQFDRLAHQSVLAALKQVDSVYYKNNFKDFDSLKMNAKNGFTHYTKTQADSIIALLKNIKNYLAQQRSKLVSLLGQAQADYVMRDERLLEQCLEENQGTNNQFVKATGFNARDKCMAENILWLLNHEGGNMMIWAHNGHINKITDRMGGHLKDSLQQQYYAIGFDFNKGGFRSMDMEAHQLKVFNVGDAAKGTTAKFFTQFNVPAFFIDLESTANSEAGPFFSKKIPSRSIGAGFYPARERWYYINEAPATEFDGLIFVNEVTSATGIH